MVPLRPRVPLIGPVRGLMRKLLRAPGISQVVRLRQMLPDRAWVIQRLGVIYSGLTSSERQKLYDIGLAAQRAAIESMNVSPTSSLPIDQIPINEHLGATVDRFERGQALIDIQDLGINFPRQGGWQFYVDSDFTGTRQEFEAMVRQRAEEIIRDEARYHKDLELPAQLNIELTPVWMMRGF